MRILAARSDSMGDVLLTGPAIRALASDGEVTLLCGPRGLEAARILPAVSNVICAELPWIDHEPKPATRAGVDALVELITSVHADEAVIFTSFHQSPLPLALVMRMAGVPRVAAISPDAYPGSLLDVRHGDPGDVHEVERALSLANAAGHALPPGDDASLRANVHASVPSGVMRLGSYVVVHPGAAVPARTWPLESYVELVAALGRGGRNVVVTGGAPDRDLTARVAAASRRAIDLGGRLDLATLGAVIRKADAIVVGNTGPAHLAAALGTPVVSLFAPVVPAVRWRPWRVPHVLLGDQLAACAGTRARTCPVPGHPCLASIDAARVLDALEALAVLERGAKAAEMGA
jgi:ADP-heptose:LPS heptosyltransferase